MAVTFTYPLAFALLAFLPVFLLVDRASLRARSRARQTFGLGVRVLGWLLLVTALANPLLATGTDTLSTAFVVDRSASVSPAEQQAALAWITRAIQAKRPSDQVAVVSFAGDAAVEQGLTATPPSIGLTAQLDAAHTDVAAALRLAEGILPPGGARRIVLLTDGNENRGQALGEVATLQAAGIPVDVVPLPSGTSPDVAVQGLNVSPAIHQGERFTINVTISATGDTAAQLRVLVDDRLDSTQALQLHAGQNNVVLSHDPLPPGMHRLSAVVEAPNDTVPENNVGYATLQVVGPPRVLLVEGTPGEARYLTPALTAAGLSVAVAAPSVLSGDVTGLRPYDVIGLVNVPAPAIGVGGLLALRSYVHDFGGGLVAIGGDQSFGAGGYRGTPLEEALPVTMDVRGRASHPNVAVALIVEDLEDPIGGDIAKATAEKLVAQLTPQDDVAISDASTGFPVPLTPARNVTAIDQAINAMETGDPPSYLPYLNQAAAQLARSPVKIKHIVLIGDGDAHDDYQPVIAAIRQQGITVSTVWTTSDPRGDTFTMQDIARWGGGRYAEAASLTDLPQLVLQDTTEVARPAITEETLVPLIQDQTPMLNGVSQLPPLYGYVATTPKSTATVGLVTPVDRDPILAQWQYGLGQSIAFTSDVSARWSSAWITWNGFTRLWGQVFKAAMPPPASQNLQVQTTVADGAAQIVVDAIGNDGSYVNNAPTTAVVASPANGRAPAGVPVTVALQQTAPGRYAGTVPADQPGNYLVRVSQTLPGQPAPTTAISGFSVPYSPEYDDLPTNLGLLHALADQTGGTFLTQPAESFQHNLREAASAQPIWPYLIGALVPLFLLDVAVRRLRFGTTELRRLLAHWRARWATPVPAAPAFAARLTAARLPALRAARPPPSRYARPAPAVTPREPPPAAPLAGGAPAPATRLLAAKRRAPATVGRPRGR